jgi:ribonuclease P protein component
MYRFPRQERLKGQKQIERLFLEGNSIYRFPVRLVYLTEDISSATEQNDYPLQVGFSVPKRKIKKAVHRNLIKRRMREAYRMRRRSVLDAGALSALGLKLQMVFVYQHHEVLDLEPIEKAVVKLLQKLDVPPPKGLFPGFEPQKKP